MIAAIHWLLALLRYYTVQAPFEAAARHFGGGVPREHTVAHGALFFVTSTQSRSIVADCYIGVVTVGVFRHALRAADISAIGQARVLQERRAVRGAEAARPHGRHGEQPEDERRGERADASRFLGLDEGRLLRGGRGVHLLPGHSSLSININETTAQFFNGGPATNPEYQRQVAPIIERSACNVESECLFFQ